MVTRLFQDGRSFAATLLLIFALTGCHSGPTTVTQLREAQIDPSGSVKATSPIAYYRLDSMKGSSEVGSSTYELTGGATISATSDSIGLPDNHFALLDGKDGWIKTTQMGGIGKTGSVMAWVNLADLPQKSGHIFYVAGESQSGNDFDLQFETDNKLRFFGAGGGNVEYAPDPATLLNHWHMIVATMDATAPLKALYWDGQPVAQDKGVNNADKKGQFTIGESPVFTGRFFNGGIDEVALWDRVLSPAEVAAIYKAFTIKP